MWNCNIYKNLGEMGGRDEKTRIFFGSLKRTRYSVSLLGWTVFPTDVMRPPPTVSFYLHSVSTQGMKISNPLNEEYLKSYKTASARWSLISSQMATIKPFFPRRDGFSCWAPVPPVSAVKWDAAMETSLTQVPLKSSWAGVKVIGIRYLWDGK